MHKYILVIMLLCLVGCSDVDDNEQLTCDDGNTSDICFEWRNGKTYGYNFLFSNEYYDVYKYAETPIVTTNDTFEIIYVNSDYVFLSDQLLDNYIDTIFLIDNEYYTINELKEVEEEIFLKALLSTSYFNIRKIEKPDLTKGEVKCFDVVGPLNQVCISYDNLSDFEGK